MGQLLSSPVTEKFSEDGENNHFFYSVTNMQGWRLENEDAHTIVLNQDDGEGDPNSFFAVYDGHLGDTVAKFAAQNVYKRLLNEESYKVKKYEAAFKSAFLGTDQDLLANPDLAETRSGCTAIVALLTPDGKIYVANAGDSRSVISIKGMVKPLSFDHKPENEVESARIAAAGGNDSDFNVSRMLGDFEYKKNKELSPENQILTANPDVLQHDISDEDEFLVLACDGIWDCMSSQNVVDVIRRKVYEGMELSEIGEFICDICVAPSTRYNRGTDNMTIMIVAILNGRTKVEWYRWMYDRVKTNYGYETPSEPPEIYDPEVVARAKAEKVNAEKAGNAE